MEDKTLSVATYTGLTEDETARFVGCLLSVGLEIVESARIAKLEQQLAEANASLEGKWISVDERLPDERVTVLVAHWMTGKGVLMKPLHGWAVWFAQRRNERWERSDGLSDDLEFHGAVKFWQPLPAPPTTATEGNEHAK